MVILFLDFKSTSILFSTVAAPTYIPTKSVGGFFFLHTLSSTHFCVLFNYDYSDYLIVSIIVIFISLIISNIEIVCEFRRDNYLLWSWRTIYLWEYPCIVYVRDVCSMSTHCSYP